MAKSFTEFVKSGLGGYGGKVGGAFAVMDAASIVTSDNKLKALLRTLRDVLLFKPLIAIGLAQAFTATGKAVNALVRETGSLEAALRRISAIQGFQKMFAPFVGGLNAAKSKLAELATLSERGPFSFEDIATGAHSLESLTNGAYSSSESIKTIGAASIATGNGITDTASAVGEFYATLRSGGPIESAADRLRQMGLISREVAEQLGTMSQNGAGTSRIFGELTSALDSTARSAGGLRDDLSTLTAEHARAVEELQRQFGAPFTAEEIENTRNMTDALQSIGPVVGRIAAFYAALFNSFNTVKTSMLAAAASSKFLTGTLEFVAKALGLVIAVASILGATAIPGLIRTVFTLTAGLYGMGGAATVAAVAIRGLLAATGIGILLLVASAVIGAVINMVQSSKEAEKALREMTKAHKEAQAAIDAHVAAITTLASRNDALAESISHVIDRQKELNAILADPKSTDAQTAEAERALKEAQAKLRALAARPTTGLASPEAAAAQELEASRRLQGEETTYRRSLALNPENRQEIEAKREKVLRDRAEAGKRGIKANQATAQERAKLGGERALVETQLSQFQTTLDDAKSGKIAIKTPDGKAKLEQAIEDKKAELNELDAKMLAAGSGVRYGKGQDQSYDPNATGTSADFETMAEQLQHAVNAEAAKAKGDTETQNREEALSGGQAAGDDAGKRIQELRIQAARQRKIENEAAAKEAEADNLATDRAAAARARGISGLQEDIDIDSHKARRTGRGAEAVRLSDENAFGSAYLSNVEAGYTGEESKTRALAKVSDDIKEQAANRPSVVDSLQRIGLGGNIGADPALDIQKRIRDLNEGANGLLEQIRKILATNPPATIAVFKE